MGTLLRLEANKEVSDSNTVIGMILRYFTSEILMWSAYCVIKFTYPVDYVFWGVWGSSCIHKIFIISLFYIITNSMPNSRFHGRDAVHVIGGFLCNWKCL